MFNGKLKIIMSLAAAFLIVFAFTEIGKQGELKTFAPTPSGLGKMTDKELMEKIGQMLIVGFRGTEAQENSDIAKVIKELKIGGVVLFDFDVPSQSFPRNIINAEQTKKLIADLQGYSSLPLFVAVDAEGGKINRLKPQYGFIDFPSAQELGDAKNYSNTNKEALKLAGELKNLGFNMNFAPVVDVNVNPKNPVIGALGRSFSSNPEEVFAHSRAFIEAHRENNIITVAKHFPGHGSSGDDSHLDAVDVTATYKKDELVPYRLLEREGLLDAVMTAHIFDKNVDKNYPATLSTFFLQDTLREELGFEGPIISDDMQMAAIAQAYGFEESIIKAINAGVDIVLFSNNNRANYDKDLPYKVRDTIFRAVKDGKITEEKIADSAERIYNLKRKFNIIR